MIKFFRKIRQRLLSENKVSKYLIYAIGEIALIVVGILIALQFNNWNLKEQNRETERATLTEMKKNLQTDLLDLEGNILHNLEKFRVNQVVLVSLEAPDHFHDTLKYYYGNIFGNTIFTKNTSAYENLLSIGIHIIQNDSLRKAITNLYSTQYNYLVSQELHDTRFQDNLLIPQILENIKTDTIFESAQPVNPVDLAGNHRFKETLKINSQLRLFINSIYADTKEMINDLMQIINDELDK